MDPTVEKRRRGRPRAYDPKVALDQARDVFWEGGYSGSSLDDLASATGMNRPSLYGAFGDKRTLYLATLRRYTEQSVLAMHAALDPKLPLAKGLKKVYQLALTMYFPDAKTPRGCLLIGTAAAESVEDEGIRKQFGDALRAFDDAFEARFRRARDDRELTPDADPAVLARLASAILHTLALRSRAGDSRAQLLATANAGITMLCAGATNGLGTGTAMAPTPSKRRPG